MLIGLFMSRHDAGDPAGRADAGDDAGRRPGAWADRQDDAADQRDDAGMTLRTVVGMLVVFVGLGLTVQVVRGAVLDSMMNMWTDGQRPLCSTDRDTQLGSAPRSGSFGRETVMADTDGDKTEAPTPRRRQEARDQGQIARSPDLTAAVLLLTTLLCSTPLVPNHGWNAQAVRRVYARRDVAVRFRRAGRGGRPGEGIQEAGIALAPLLVGIVIVAMLANIVQVGLVFNPARLTPNLEPSTPSAAPARFRRRVYTRKAASCKMRLALPSG